MPINFTEQTFRSTYKDDWRDSDNYSRILFNAGRALQARELTQMQTIIQEEIRKFANNIFQKDGVPILAGGVSVNNKVPFIKISTDLYNSFDNVDLLKNVELTGATSGVKVRIFDAIAATGSDPDTLYVNYISDSNTENAGEAHSTRRRTARLVDPGERLQGTLKDGVTAVDLTVQTIDTTANPALGKGMSVEIGESNFYVLGHFVFVEKQRLIISKYQQNRSRDVGFKLVQDIVTVNDTESLYDNQNATPNRSSPGADRYRIRLVLTTRDQIQSGETFVYMGRINHGTLMHQMGSESGFNQVKKYVNRGIKEINGDFIKKYWKLRIQPNANPDYLNLKIDPGLAYIDGQRVESIATRTIPIRKVTDTITNDDEQIGIDYGNYYYFDSGLGLLDIDVCEAVNLYSGYSGSGDVIGTANIRAITEGSARRRVDGYNYKRVPQYKAHLFNVDRNNFDYSLQDVLSIKSQSNAHYVNLVPASLNGIANRTLGTILHEPRKNALIFDTPIRRPKQFTDVTITYMKKYSFQASGTQHTLTLTDAGETFVNESDIIIAANVAASATENGFMPILSGASIQNNNKEILFTGLTNAVDYEVITFIRKTNASVKTKSLVETTVAATLSNDSANGGPPVRYINLGKSDIYSLERIRKTDSDGDDIFPNFLWDAGQRVGFNGDGRLIWTGGGMDSTDTVFVRFKYFQPSVSGQFYAVNSYDGQVDYLKVPAQKLPAGGEVSLRDVIDFRPSTDGSGNFTTVPPLPVPADTITVDAEYYIPRADKLVISKDGELRYIKGSPNLNPKYPEVPEDCMDLYNIKLNPNTMHSQDLVKTLIPRKGYTMADINKLEEKIDKIQEMTTLSLLELNTKFLKVLDSDGVDRTKSGFFVDTFKNHAFSQTSSKDYRASIDPTRKYLRPTYSEDVVNLFYDSNDTDQLRTTIKEDKVMLAYREVAFDAQTQASGTENLAPFFIPQVIGNLRISPEVDTWKDNETVGEIVVGRSSEFDLRQAVNWNSSENEWYGMDPSSLDVGDTNEFVSNTFTTISHNAEDPTLIGEEVTESYTDWVELGTTIDTETLYSEDFEVSRERVEENERTSVVTATVEVGLGGSYEHEQTGWMVYNSSYNSFDVQYEIISKDLYDVITKETRDKVRTTTTSTYNRTKTIEKENTYEGNVEIVTKTFAESATNRIASQSIIHEVVGSRLINTSVIPFMRPIRINFKAEGLRPNTQYFPYFDDTNVSAFCREETQYRTLTQFQADQIADDLDDEGTQSLTKQHSQGKSNLITDDEGTVIGSFEVPNNSHMRFPTGTREFCLLDVNAKNTSQALSYCTARFTATGAVDEYEDEIRVIRSLKVVGSTDNVLTDRDVSYESTTWTESVVTEEILEDVRSANTVSWVATGDYTTDKVFVETETTYNLISAEGQQPSDTTPGGGNTSNDDDYTDIDDIRDDDDLWETEPDYESGQPGGGKGGGFNSNNYYDPLAQTFNITRTGGVFLTSVEAYFASKPATGAGAAPVFCEIRPTVNGVPSSQKVLDYAKLRTSQVTLVPAGSNNAQMLNYPTKFVFDSPVYLPRGEYAIVLRPGNNSPDYNVYVATVGEKQLGSSSAFISQQPTLGAFFKSQNGKLWEPSSQQDLSYKINVAKFETSGKAILENANLYRTPLSPDPFYCDSGSNVVRVAMRGNGFRTGDQTRIKGIDSAYDFGNGLTGADVLQVRTVLSADNSGYTFQAGSSSNGRGWFGGKTITSQRNLSYETLRPVIGIAHPRATNTTMSIKTTSQSSLAGSETRYDKDTSYSIIENKKDTVYRHPKAIYCRLNERRTGAGLLGGDRSATLQIGMTTTDPFVSPVIDMQQAILNCKHNLISKQTDGYADTSLSLTVQDYLDDSGETLALQLTSSSGFVPSTTISQTISTLAGKTIASEFPDYKNGFYFTAGTDSADLIISREDGKPFSLNVNPSSTGTWSITDNATATLLSDSSSATIDVVGSTQTPVSGFNIPLTYISERHPSMGSESAKHITRKVTLAEEAVGLKVIVAANRPPEADFQIWWRTAGDGNDIYRRGWQLVNPQKSPPPDTNRNVFREYQYLIGGDTSGVSQQDQLEPFTTFQIKIVMRSTNQAAVPTFRDLRVIALAT